MRETQNVRIPIKKKYVSSSAQSVHILDNLKTGSLLSIGKFCDDNCVADGIIIISVIVPMLTNYLGTPLIYLTAASFFPESEGVNVNASVRIL